MPVGGEAGRLSRLQQSRNTCGLGGWSNGGIGHGRTPCGADNRLWYGHQKRKAVETTTTYNTSKRGFGKSISLGKRAQHKLVKVSRTSLAASPFQGGMWSPPSPSEHFLSQLSYSTGYMRSPSTSLMNHGYF